MPFVPLFAYSPGGGVLAHPCRPGNSPDAQLQYICSLLMKDHLTLVKRLTRRWKWIDGRQMDRMVNFEIAVVVILQPRRYWKEILPHFSSPAQSGKYGIKDYKKQTNSWHKCNLIKCQILYIFGLDCKITIQFRNAILPSWKWLQFIYLLYTAQPCWYSWVIAGNSH